MASSSQSNTQSGSQPSQQQVQTVIGLLNNKQLAQAESLAKELINKYPQVFILHQVLGLSLDGQQKFAEAVISYQNAVNLQPNKQDPSLPEVLFNLGIALTQLNRLEEAVNAYQQALLIKPNFFEAHGNLGTLLQGQGKLEAALSSYQAGLKINPQDARGHFNLGTVLRDKGDLQAAVNSYQKAIQLFPNYTDAHNNLGETLRDQGNMDAAIKSYQAALMLNPNHANANYNMAEFLYLAKKYDEAITYFERSQLDDWQARKLYCLYKAEKFDAFAANRDALLKQGSHHSPLVATLSTHYSINFNQADPYNFCKNGLDFVYQNHMLNQDSDLLKALLNDINSADIAERKQGRLTNGQQSAGNLFKRPEASFRALAALIKQAFLNYKNKFSNANCELIKAFPNELEFTSSWYVKMQQGGHLSAHIHEIGWLSGAVYLAMPTSVVDSTEGAFEYGTHGDEYPILLPKTQKDFPVAQIMPRVGDIILFPSSLFHRTIPFYTSPLNANESRICIAFDLKPPH